MLLCNSPEYMNFYEREIAVHKGLFFKNTAGFIYILWLIGFMVGLAIAWNAPLQTEGVFLTPSFVGLFVSSLPPVLLCLLFSRRKKEKALFVLILLNGFLYGFSSVILSLMNPGAGFIIRVVYLLSQSSSSLLLLYISGSYRHRSCFAFKKLIVCSICCLVAISVLHYIILTKGLLRICWI